MKKKFETPELVLILFADTDDIITTSGPNGDNSADMDENSDF